MKMNCKKMYYLMHFKINLIFYIEIIIFFQSLLVQLKKNKGKLESMRHAR